MAAVAVALLAVAGWQWSAGRTEARINEQLFVECLSRAQTPADASQCTDDFYDRRDQQLAQPDRGRHVAAGVLLAEDDLPTGLPPASDPTRPRAQDPPRGVTSTTVADGVHSSALPDRPAAAPVAAGGEAVSAEAPSTPRPPTPADEPGAAAPAPGTPAGDPTTTCAAPRAASSPTATPCPSSPAGGGQDSQGGHAGESADFGTHDAGGAAAPPAATGVPPKPARAP